MPNEIQSCFYMYEGDEKRCKDGFTDDRGRKDQKSGRVSFVSCSLQFHSIVDSPADEPEQL
jgi:hypothetical protein